MTVTGVVDRGAIPVVERVREGSAADVDLLDSVDRRTRGAAHLPTTSCCSPSSASWSSTTPPAPATRTSTPTVSPALLAATNRRTAAP